MTPSTHADPDFSALEAGQALRATTDTQNTTQRAPQGRIFRLSPDTLESLANATLGLVVSWVLTVFALGYTPTQGAAVTAMFFAASFTRARLIRWGFRKWAS